MPSPRSPVSGRARNTHHSRYRRQHRAAAVPPCPSAGENGSRPQGSSRRKCGTPRPPRPDRLHRSMLAAPTAAQARSHAPGRAARSAPRIERKRCIHHGRNQYWESRRRHAPEWWSDRPRCRHRSACRPQGTQFHHAPKAGAERAPLSAVCHAESYDEEAKPMALAHLNPFSLGSLNPTSASGTLTSINNKTQPCGRLRGVLRTLFFRRADAPPPTQPPQPANAA